ncbi:Scr1 family TA system antitoxin-like transcriptional regulator [Streptomyces sp. NBC_00091]|uniref:Scr1 family TA system antitoxin-like transcriptional regulator n=1 Tax=Streptomyces sp. NBC_00091 TaxID=2975648 RepID=UPI00224CFEF2|nr:Scr1 family TA system antitoxin-like transcriptional regulator [Streptomyces sp. NBC_00091]MCX5376217.1 Scr1 family TA system antitoxin-like transcriptional regulator [Streptomyces sp. NBC_00091]
MPPRTSPTYRQARLGAELRKMRLHAGVTAEFAAGLLGIDRGKIPNIESGVRTLSPERLRTLATNYGCTDEAYLTALAAMAQPRTRGWWDQHRGQLSSGMLDIAELEWHATRLHTIQTVHIPGLLQTEAYARAIFSAVLPELSRLEVELRVSHRQERRRVLERAQPVPYIGFVHEAALRMHFGGRQAARAQLEHLGEQSTADHITIRVIPVSQGIFPGAGHALLYAEGVVPQLDTAQLDSAHGPAFMHAEGQLSKYRSHLEWMEAKALDASASRDFIHRVHKEL